jgi:hypothetical protein
MAELGFGYAAITKADEQPDGTMFVYGKATDESLDADLQIVDNAWMKSAMPDWMSAGGNIREQHSSIAAGVATELEEKADGFYIRAHVVDPTSVLKVKHGVLKGFSIGVRGARVVRDEKAIGGRIVGGTVVEVSLVDRPANPNAKLMLAKADDLGKLTAVTIEMPKPSDLFKSEEVEAEVVEAPVVDETPAIEETPVEVVEETPVEEVTPEAEIVEAAKSLLATVNKFDQATYDAAIAAISDLIIIEAGEMKAGSDERDSIKDLLGATKRLYSWYAGEADNGEVANPNPAIVGDDDSDMDSGVDDDSVEAIYADKSLTLDPSQVESVLEKAIDAAKAAVSSEMDSMKSALEAEVAKSVELKAELEVALSKAVSGGPARMGSATPNKNSDLLLKAADYRAKASNPAITDRALKQGWIEIAEGLEAKARKEK